MDDTYRLRFYSLFLDFIEAFKELNYRGIPLPLLSQFNRYVNSEMFASPTELLVKNKIVRLDQIQPGFQRYLDRMGSDLMGEDRFGSILLDGFSTVFRLPKERLPFQTVTVPIKWITPKEVAKYKSDTREISQLYIEKAKRIISSFHEPHPFNQLFFQYKWLEDIPQMIHWIDRISGYLDHQKVACVLVGTTETLKPRTLTLAACIRGIPSICLQHSVIRKENSYMPVFATKQAVYGQYERDWFQLRGVKNERISTTGHPRFDAIFVQPSLSSRQKAEKLGLDPHKESVLIATQPSEKLWVELIELLAQNTDLGIVIKPHRTEIAKKMTTDYEVLCSKYPSVKLAPSGSALYDMIQVADLVVVGKSTVGLEAMLLNKTVVVLGAKDDHYYRRLGVLFQSDPSKLVKVINKLLWSDNMKRYAKIKRKQFTQYAYSSPESSKNLERLLLEMIKYSS